MAGRSQIVTVSLVGLAGLMLAGGLSRPSPQMRYNTYRSREDCERDYSPAQCASGSGGGTYGGTAHSWHGPSYYADRSATQARGDPGPGRFGLRAGIVN